MSQNKLKLSDDKAELIILSWQTHKCNKASITIGDFHVTKSDCVRHLGILFDSTMHMKQQIAAVVKQAATSKFRYKLVGYVNC